MSPFVPYEYELIVLVQKIRIFLEARLNGGNESPPIGY